MLLYGQSGFKSSILVISKSIWSFSKSPTSALKEQVVWDTKVQSESVPYFAHIDTYWRRWLHLRVCANRFESVLNQRTATWSLPFRKRNRHHELRGQSSLETMRKGWLQSISWLFSFCGLFRSSANIMSKKVEYWIGMLFGSNNVSIVPTHLWYSSDFFGRKLDRLVMIPANSWFCQERGRLRKCGWNFHVGAVLEHARLPGTRNLPRTVSTLICVKYEFVKCHWTIWLAMPFWDIVHTSHSLCSLISVSEKNTVWVGLEVRYRLATTLWKMHMLQYFLKMLIVIRHCKI